MTAYEVRIVDEAGELAERFTIRCADIGEAASLLTSAASRGAVLVRPVANELNQANFYTASQERRLARAGPNTDAQYENTTGYISPNSVTRANAPERASLPRATDPA